MRDSFPEGVKATRILRELRDFEKDVAVGDNASPRRRTRPKSGRAILAKDPKSPGSLGIAISEAVEMAAKDPAVKYSLGSVLNHVLLHQTVNGQEAIKQFEMAGTIPTSLSAAPAAARISPVSRSRSSACSCAAAASAASLPSSRPRVRR